MQLLCNSFSRMQGNSIKIVWLVPPSTLLHYKSYSIKTTFKTLYVFSISSLSWCPRISDCLELKKEWLHRMPYHKHCVQYTKHCARLCDILFCLNITNRSRVYFNVFIRYDIQFIIWSVNPFSFISLLRKWNDYIASSSTFSIQMYFPHCMLRTKNHPHLCVPHRLRPCLH